MSVAAAERGELHVEASGLTLPQGGLGPQTRRRLMRTAIIYAVMVALGAASFAFDLDAAWKSAGLGLWLPGGGFLALGPWGTLALVATLILFALSLVFWFGAGMVVGPLIIWLGAAGAAGLLAGDEIWAPSPFITAGLVVAFFAAMSVNQRRITTNKLKLRQLREAHLPQSFAAAKARAEPAPPPGERELSPIELSVLRYALDRALQPIDQWNGFDRVDEFQTAARRYQINFLGYALGLAHNCYTPSFHGYLAEAQRRLIERYLQPKLWRYWVYESIWGHLNFTNFDPAGKDNIMLTGFFAQQLGLYTSATGDTRYAEPGALPFRLNARKTFAHDMHSIAGSVADNIRRSPFALYPCEPNWVYSACNHIGYGGLAIYDRLFDTNHVQETRERWFHMLDTEMTDRAGGVIGLRSTYTGLEFTFPAGEAGFAMQTNAFDAERAWRQWATARIELGFVLKPGPDGRLRISLPGSGFDFGNYKPGHGMSYSGIASAAREFGDSEIADAALRSLDQDCSPTSEGGVLRYTAMSNLGNAGAVIARVRRLNFWREAFLEGPPKSVFRGPLLTDASYPDVLVAKAFSDGDGLDLVLYPGGGPGVQTIGVGRLTPGRRYAVVGAAGGIDSVTADGDGCASFDVDLKGRTEVVMRPAAPAP